MSLNFDVLRQANVMRCESVFHPLSIWSPMEWAGAAAGEMGEACNVAKKLRRLEMAPSWNSPDDRNPAKLTQQLGDEIADTIIYLDLLAARCGIDLGTAVARKFNRTSDKVGSTVRLPV